jgi:two-component system sensor histidine kinase EvgS
MRKLLHLPLFIVLIVTSGLSFGQPVRSAAEPGFPPLSIVRPDGTAGGFSVELLRAALAEVHREVVFKTAPFDQIKTELAEGQLDVLPLVGRTPEHEAGYDLTIHYLTLHGALFVRNDETAIQSLSDLSGKRIAVMKGDNAEEYVLRAKLSDQIISTTTFDEAFRLLSSGEADAVITQKLMGVSLLKELNIQNVRVVGQPNQEFKQDFCFGVKKGNAELLAALNEGLSIVSAKGINRQLQHRWMGPVEYEATTSRVLIYAGDQAYPPFEFLDTKGTPSGFNIDLIKALSKEIGVEISIQLLPWSEVRHKADANEIDLTSMLYSEGRDQNVDYSVSLLASAQAVFARNDSPAYQVLSDLKACRISVQDGDLAHDFAIEHGLGENLTVTKGPQEALKLLAEGRVDFSLGSLLQGQYWIKKNGWKNLRVVEPQLYVTDYCFAVPEDRSDLLNLINAGLLQLKNSGEYRRIYNEWLGPLDPAESWKKFRRYLLIGGGGAFLLAALTGLWISLLRRQVHKKTAELRGIGERFELATKAGGIGVWDRDIIRDRLIWDERMISLYGIEPADFTGSYEAWTRCLHPDDKERALAEVAAAERGEKPFNTEFRIIRPDGAIRHIRAFGKVLRDEKGQPIRLIGTNQDITEQQEQAQGFNSFFEQSLNLHLMVAADGTILRVNKGWSAVLGYTREELEGRCFLDLVHPDYIEATRHKIKRLENEKFIDYFENCYRHADGSFRMIAWSTTSPPGDDILYSVGQDITERKKAEQKLKESEEKLRSIIEHSTNIFYSHTVDQELTYVSQQVKEILGYEVDEALVHWTDLVSDHPGNEIGMKRTQDAIRTGKAQPTYELQLLHKDGHPVWVEVREAPVVENGKTVAIVGSITDVTQRMEAEERLRIHNRELERFNKASVGRELRMIELKKEVNRLCRETGRPEPYPLHSAGSADEGAFDESV